MQKLHSVNINTEHGVKEICVCCDDVTRFDANIDIMTTSAFHRSYAPTPRTVFGALFDSGIDVRALASAPALDLRNTCHIWLSEEIPAGSTRIRRIGCIEFGGDPAWHSDPFSAEQSVLTSIRAYFRMLDIASLYGVAMETVALPLVGSGAQKISGNLLLIPLLNECLSFLKRNSCVSKIYFIEKNPEKAERIAQALKNSLRFSESAPVKPQEPPRDRCAFISYSSKDKNIADNLCFKLESRGVKVWYAPRDVRGPYAAAIATAIDQANYFVVLLSQNSVASEHVLNEIDLAFQNISKGLRFKPLRIDDAMFTPSMKYYLSRQHWMDATVPPLEERLNEFVADLLGECQQ